MLLHYIAKYLFGNITHESLVARYYFYTIGEIIMSGGWTMFYYFVALLFLTVIAKVLHRMLQEKLSNLSIIMPLFVFSLSLLIIVPLIYSKLDYKFANYHLVNFVPYVFSAVILFRISKQERKYNYVALLFLLYFVFSVLEWVFMEEYQMLNTFSRSPHLLPEYTRISVVFGSMFFCCVFNAQIYVPKIVKVLSDNSLGIYCFHGFSPVQIFWGTSFLPVKPIPSLLTTVIFVFVCIAIARKIKWLNYFI